MALMLKRHQKDYVAPFEMIDFSAIVEHRQGRGIFAEATVKVRVKGEVFHTAAEGDGPVNALDTRPAEGTDISLPGNKFLSSG